MTKTNQVPNCYQPTRTAHHKVTNTVKNRYNLQIHGMNARSFLGLEMIVIKKKKSCFIPNRYKLVKEGKYQRSP